MIWTLSRAAPKLPNRILIFFNCRPLKVIENIYAVESGIIINAHNVAWHQKSQEKQVHNVQHRISVNLHRFQLTIDFHIKTCLCVFSLNLSIYSANRVKRKSHAVHPIRLSDCVNAYKYYFIYTICVMRACGFGGDFFCMSLKCIAFN